MLLGRQPLPPLDEAEGEGLREFLVDELPKLVRGLSYLRFLPVQTPMSLVAVETG